MNASRGLDVTDPSGLVAVTCVSPAEAERALAAVRDLDVELLDAAIVVHTLDGRVELHQTQELAPGEGIVAGGTAGLVAGMLLGGPVAGALLGMLGGGVWAARDTGVEDERLRELGATLEQGSALFCALVGPDDVSPVRDTLARYGTVAEVGAPAVGP